MKVLIATDGSKYGKWATEWVARMPFAEKPEGDRSACDRCGSAARAVYVQPVVIGNEPFIQEEIKKRIETRAKTTVAAKAQMASLKFKGKLVSERGAAATILGVRLSGTVWSRSGVVAWMRSIG